MLRALIVDDEPPARRKLRALLREEPAVTVVGEAGDGVAAVDAVEALTPDLVFLDVQMPGRDGFEVVEDVAVRGRVRCPAVIFVTAFDRYAVKAFDVHAVDYLLKPFGRERLREAIVRAGREVGEVGLGDRLMAVAEEATRHRPPRRFVVRTRDRWLIVDAEKVDWFEAMGHYVGLHVGAQTYLVRDGIADLASRLDSARFSRIHRGAIVNHERVAELRPRFHGEFDVVLKDGTRLRATRTYAANVIKRLS